MKISRRQPLGDQIFDLLRQRIVTGEIAAGQRLVQGQLATELGTSRLPVRDALRRLESEGLLSSDELGRYSVPSFTAEDAAEVYAIRRRLEPMAISLAAERASAEEIRRIQSLVAQMERCLRDKCLDRYVELNAHFHTLIYDASRAPRLVQLVRTLWVGVPPLTPIAVPDRMRRSHAEHIAIVERLAARDGEGAARALDRHIDNACRELIAALHAEEAPTSASETARQVARRQSHWEEKRS